MKLSFSGSCLTTGLLGVLQVRPRPLRRNCRTVWTLFIVLFTTAVVGLNAVSYVYEHVWVEKDWGIGHVSLPCHEL